MTTLKKESKSRECDELKSPKVGRPFPVEFDFELAYVVGELESAFESTFVVSPNPKGLEIVLTKLCFIGHRLIPENMVNWHAPGKMWRGLP